MGQAFQLGHDFQFRNSLRFAGRLKKLSQAGNPSRVCQRQYQGDRKRVFQSFVSTEFSPDFQIRLAGNTAFPVVFSAQTFGANP